MTSIADPLPHLPPQAGEGTANPLYVEITPLLTPRLTGIGRFTARLVEALSRRQPLRLFGLHDRSALPTMHLRPEISAGATIAVDAPLPPIDGDLDAWTTALLRRPQQRLDADAARGAAAVYTLFRPHERRFRREVSVLYDFTPFLLPECHEPGTRTLFAEFIAEAARFSDRALAISRSTRNDALWLTALAPDDVVAAYPGPSLCDAAHADPAPVQRAPNRILVVSTREPRKNAAFLRDWFLTSERIGPDTELCWVGPQGWMWDVADAPGSDARRRRFRFLGHVSDARLCALYREAACTIYPSLYEGFGFPVLDSLRHDTPVLCSFNSALAEFDGLPGVFHFDPTDPASLDRAWDELAAARPHRIDQPALRATYSWDRLAESLAELLRDQPATSAAVPTTRETLRTAVSRLPWWHRIDLGDGIVTPGKVDCEHLLRFLRLPERLDGLSVLDIGAWDGFYSFACERRGAARVLATDSHCWTGAGWGTKRAFALARAALRSRVEDLDIDVMDLSPERVGRFDLVLMLGVLYHLRDPLLGLERVASVTGSHLILETHVDMLDQRGPAMRFYPGAELNDDASNWWGPNPACVESMLRTVGFTRVEMVPESSYPSRRVFHAWRDPALA